MCDLAVFSPPYPNSFDYTDVYNIELWTLGYIRDAASNQRLRSATLSSHVQIGRKFCTLLQDHPCRGHRRRRPVGHRARRNPSPSRSTSSVVWFRCRHPQCRDQLPRTESGEDGRRPTSTLRRQKPGALHPDHPDHDAEAAGIPVPSKPYRMSDLAEVEGAACAAHGVWPEVGMHRSDGPAVVRRTHG